MISIITLRPGFVFLVTSYLDNPRDFRGYSHTYDRPDMRQQQQQQQQMTGLQRQGSIDSHVYMELEPDPSVQTGYVVSSKSTFGGINTSIVLNLVPGIKWDSYH